MNILSKIQTVPDQVVNAAIILIILVLFYILYLTIKNDRSSKIREIERVISLEQLSELWTNRNSTSIEVPLDVLTPIWREVEEEGEDPEIILRHDRARQFWNRISKYFKRSPIHRQVCAHLITILDQDGDCPSVVNKKSFVNDIESSWDSNSYSMLGMTKLIDHSINVAEHVIDLLIDIEAQHVIPDGIIAALAHDIGKIPSLQSHLYASGDHPIVAGSILTTLTGFKDLPEHDRTAIAQAVKHHHINCEGLLPQNVRRADQLSRQDEMDWAVLELSSSREELTRSIPPGNQQALAAHEQASGQPGLAANAPAQVVAASRPEDTQAVTEQHTTSPVATPVTPALNQASQTNPEQNLVTPAEAVATGASMRDFLTGGQTENDQSDALDEPDEYEDETNTPPNEPEDDSNEPDEPEEGPEDDSNETCPSADMMFGGSPQQVAEQMVDDENDSGSEDGNGEVAIPVNTEPEVVMGTVVEQQPAAINNVSTQHLPRLAPDPYPNQSGVPAGMENVQPGDPTKAYAADNAIFGNGHVGSSAQNQTAAKKDAPQIIQLGDWFDEKALIDQLKPHINKTSGKTFRAFSMPDGVVYIQTGLIESIIREMASASNIADIPTLVSGCSEMKNILLSVVNRLKNKGFIEETLVQKGYYGGYFLIQKRSGATKPGYFTPFRAETFGMPSELEELKDFYKSRYALDFVNVAPNIGQDK